MKILITNYSWSNLITLLNFWFISLFFLILFSCSASCGMPDNDPGTKLNYGNQPAKDITIRPEVANTNQNHNQLLDFVWGGAPKNGVIYLPFGRHTQIQDENLTVNNLVGVVYNSISLGTFINSFREQTWYLVVMRNIFSYHGFGIDYFAGILYGYNGKLANVKGIPFRDTFLFKYNLNPIISLDTYYEITDYFHIQAMITPLVILSGIKYNF